MVSPIFSLSPMDIDAPPGREKRKASEAPEETNPSKREKRNSPILDLPEELIQKILTYVGEISPSTVNKKFRECNTQATNELWKSVESKLRAKDSDPISFAYIQDLSPRMPLQKRYRFVHNLIQEDIEPDILRSLNASKRIFDLTFYEELSRKITDLSLERAWPEMRFRILEPEFQEEGTEVNFPLAIAENDPISGSSIPPSGSPARVIRNWINDSRNQTTLEDVDLLFFDFPDEIQDPLYLLPEEIKKFTGCRALSFKKCNIICLQKDALKCLTELITFNATYNSIRKIDAAVFQGLHHLTYLHLYNSKIRAFPETLFRGLSALENLDLGGNPSDPLPATLLHGLTHLERFALPHIIFRYLGKDRSNDTYHENLFSLNFLQGLRRLKSFLIGKQTYSFDISPLMFKDCPHCKILMNFNKT